VRDYGEQNELQTVVFEVKEEEEIEHDWDDPDPDWAPLPDDHSDEDPLGITLHPGSKTETTVKKVAKTKKCSIVLEKIDGTALRLRRSTRKRKSSAKGKKWSDSESDSDDDEEWSAPTSKKIHGPGLRYVYVYFM